MIGAIIGDIVGSRYEFNNIKTKNFKLFGRDSKFTDDTVLTIAVADWIMNRKDDSIEEASRFLQKWARKYPYAGYGGKFRHWIWDESPKPYNSCGNGSAMRISALGWLANNEQELLKLNDIITGCTHNHPEGMKGALVVATMIFRANNGATKEELREYAIEQYPEIATFDYKTLVRDFYHGKETCQETVPQALYCFLISHDFDDCLRTTISIGGDCDTTTAMSCAIAQAYYKYIPDYVIQEAFNRLPDDMQLVLARVSKTLYD